MKEQSMYAEWIAVDWGTTHLRGWAISDAGDVLATAISDDGMNKLAQDRFEPALLRMAEDWLAPGRKTQVVACGMIGARQGWQETPYRAVPCTPIAETGLVRILAKDPRLDVHAVPGLSQASPADVMRGEETKIAGILAGNAGFDGVICLPGTHSKWVHISAGEVVSYQTFMTGELFSLLSKQSALRHGMMGGGWDDAAFDSALGDSLSRPESIAARLFSLRAEGLLAGLSSGAARARLSGLLIGAELAASRPYWLGQNILIVGADAVSAAYARGLQAQGVTARRLPADMMTLAGLTSARITLTEPLR
jgi:2-dehydro-3-deoxygalactonokinase